LIATVYDENLFSKHFSPYEVVILRTIYKTISFI